MINHEALKQFDLLYENTYFDVSKYVVCKCSNPEDVEDILQNIYLAVFKAVSKNVNITKPADVDIESSLIDKYDTDFVWEYLKSKKVIIFKVFYLYFKLELTIKEISECLSLTESNVKHYLYRTIRRT